MQAPVVVRTRLRPPVPYPDELVRPRLLARLDEMTEPVVLVAAPRGAGKTVMLAQWARARDPRASWVSLSSYDDTTAGVWSAVLAAVRPSCAGVPEPSAWQLSEPSLVFRQIIPALLNALAAGPLTLILDGLDVIQDPVTRASLYEFVSLLPGGARAVLATARPVGGPVAGLRAAGRLAEVGEDDLKFTLSETRLLLDGMTGRVMPAGQAAALHSQFDGWATGLRLAGLAMRDQPAGVPLPVPLPAVEDFFRAELLDRLSPSQRRLLVRSSILDELTPGRCEAVTGVPGAGEMLVSLAASSLLLRRHGQGIRCHPALRAVLSAVLAAEEPDDVARLQARAAVRMRSESRCEAAFDHAVLSGDPDLGAQAAARAWPGIHPGRLLSGLDMVGGPAGGACPAAAAAELARGDTAAAGQRLGDAAGSGAAAVRALLALMRGDLETATAEAGLAAREDTAGQPPWPAVMADVVLGSALVWEGRPAEATRILAGAARRARACGYRDMEVRALDARTAALALAGEAQPAVATAQEAVSLYRLDTTRCAAPAIALAELAVTGIRDPDRGLPAQPVLEAGEAAGQAAPHARAYAAVLLAGTARVGTRPGGAGLAMCRAGVSMSALRAGPVLEALLAREPGARSSPADPAMLSQRERAVLRALAGPLTLREIAEELHLSHNTVKSHVQAVFRKLGAHDRAEAVARGMSSGLLAPRRAAAAEHVLTGRPPAPRRRGC